MPQEIQKILDLPGDMIEFLNTLNIIDQFIRRAKGEETPDEMNISFPELLDFSRIGGFADVFPEGFRREGGTPLDELSNAEGRNIFLSALSPQGPMPHQALNSIFKHELGHFLGEAAGQGQDTAESAVLLSRELPQHAQGNLLGAEILRRFIAVQSLGEDLAKRRAEARPQDFRR